MSVLLERLYEAAAAPAEQSPRDRDGVRRLRDLESLRCVCGLPVSLHRGPKNQSLTCAEAAATHLSVARGWGARHGA